MGGRRRKLRGCRDEGLTVYSQESFSLGQLISSDLDVRFTFSTSNSASAHCSAGHCYGITPTRQTPTRQVRGFGLRARRSEGGAKLLVLSESTLEDWEVRGFGGKGS